MNEDEILLERYKETIQSNRKHNFSAAYVIGLIIFIIALNIIPFTVKQLVLIFGAFLCTISVYYFGIQFQTSFWIKTNCKILKKEVTSQGGQAFFPNVYYLYTVNEKKYICNKVNFDPLGSSKILKAEDKMKTYEEGNNYNCYYNSKKPDQAVLINNLGYYPILLFCLGILIISFSLL